MTANTRYLRAGRARARSAATLLRQAVALLRESTGLESMPVGTANRLAELARRWEGAASDIAWWASKLAHHEVEANRHLSEMRKKRRAA